MNINFLDAIDLSLGKDGGVIENCIRALVYLVCDLIYSLIIWVYSIFERLCNARILDGEILETIAERVGIVLGIIMLFMVIFSVIQMILEPDKLTDKEKGLGNIAKKIILVVVMLGVSGATFRMLYGLQTNLIKSNIVQKFLLPYDITEDVDFGGVLSANLFTSFYTFNTNGIDMSSTHNWEPNDIKCYNQYAQLQKNIKNKEGFNAGRYCVNLVRDNGEHIMSFNWLLSPLVGGAVLYFIFTYCITVGVRSIQLAFLEIISSMAIISYLSPKKDNMFQKWIKLYFATYVDVFLRIMIINLVAFLILIIFENVDEQIFWDSVGRANDFSDTVILVLIILALLTFAKKAPELIKNLFPPGDSKLGLGFTAPKQLFSNMLGGNLIEKGVKTGAKVATVGTAIGLSNALTSGISRYKINKKNGKTGWDLAAGTIGGVFSGLGRGYVAGAQKGNPFSVYSKGVKAQRDLNDKYDELITSGGDIRGKMGANFAANFGETKGQEYTRIVSNNESVSKEYSAINDAAEGFKYVKIAKTIWENAKARGESNEKIKEAYDNYKLVKKAHITDALQGKKFEEAEDQSIAAGITVHKTELENLVTYKNVELVHEVPDLDKDGHERYDDKGNLITKTERITTFENYDSINDASISANTNIAEIKKKEEYSKAIANDRAAGVNSNGSGKK